MATLENEAIQTLRSLDNYTEQNAVLTKELDKTIEFLQQKGVKLVSKKPQQTLLGRLISFYDPFGYISEVIEVKNEEGK